MICAVYCSLYDVGIDVLTLIDLFCFVQMFRSEYSHQRSAALRMIAGILLRRDCVVAMEAYSDTFADRSNTQCKSNLQSSVTSNPILTVEDELGQKSNILTLLSTCIEGTVNQLKYHMFTSKTGNIIYSVQQQMSPLDFTLSP